MKVVYLLVATALLGVSLLTAADYEVDALHSTIGFKVRHMMVASVRGTFKEYKGSYSYDPKTHIIQSLQGVVKVASIFTDDKKRDEHLLSKDFFDVQKYPTMSLELIRHIGDRVILNLTIKGITKQIEFDVVSLSNESKDPWGAIKTGFELNGKINRSDYNILFNKVLETGGVAVGDEVKILLELEGIKIKGK